MVAIVQDALMVLLLPALSLTLLTRSDIFFTDRSFFSSSVRE